MGSAIADASEWSVTVERGHEIDSCGLTSSELPIGEVTPLSYHLLLDVDLDSPQFGGMVEISLQINKKSNRILLNAGSVLDLEEIWYKDLGRILANGRDSERIVRVEDACLNIQREILVINLEQTLEPETLGQLNVAYLGSYEQNSALMKMSYPGKMGKTSRVLLSELEPLKDISVARRLFPCFDEPQLEAFIELDVLRKADVKVRSNGELKSDESLTSDGRKLIKFERTDPIAPQKLYFTASD